MKHAVSFHARNRLPTAANDHDDVATPRAGEVVRDVVLVVAVHFVLALCLVLALGLFGIGGGIPMHFL
jgi:hypothetical protein